MQSLFALGNSITVDPATRRVVRIDGQAIAEKDHTHEMQAFADRALADLHEPDAPGPAFDPATDDPRLIVMKADAGDS